MYSIKQMPSDARVWVYQSNKALSDIQVSEIERAGQYFITGWTAHGASLKASFDVIYNRFIVIAVDENQASAGGCSIDASTRFIKEIEKQFNLDLFDRMQTAYRSGNEIKSCNLNKLLEELTLAGIYSDDKSKDASGDVIVFNNMVNTKKAFDSEWEVKLKNSWHSRILPVPQK